MTAVEAARRPSVATVQTELLNVHHSLVGKGAVADFITPLCGGTELKCSHAMTVQAGMKPATTGSATTMPAVTLKQSTDDTTARPYSSDRCALTNCPTPKAQEPHRSTSVQNCVMEARIPQDSLISGMRRDVANSATDFTTSRSNLEPVHINPPMGQVAMNHSLAGVAGAPTIGSGGNIGPVNEYQAYPIEAAQAHARPTVRTYLTSTYLSFFFDT